jgi:hypothetical protein
VLGRYRSSERHQQLRTKQAGFSATHALVLVIVAVVLIGAVYYSVNSHKAARELPISTTPAAVQSPESTAPDGYAVFTDPGLKVTFDYPKNWGAPAITKNAGKMGEEVSIKFSSFPVSIFDEPIVTLATPDFVRSFATDSFIPNGVKDYAKTRTANIAHDAQRQAGSSNYSTTMLAVADRYYLSAAYDCVAGGVYVGGSAKLAGGMYGGFTVEYFDTKAKPDCAGNATTAVKGYDAEISAQLNTVLSTVQSLK